MEHVARSLADVDLNLLVALDALLQERSVTRAGGRLSLSQPSMSGSLSRLRVLFGDELLIRRGRTMHPTPLAEMLEAPVREILAQVEQTVFHQQEFIPLQGSRTFTVAATDYAVLILVRPLLQALASEAPGIRLRLRATGFADQKSLLERGEIDLAIVPDRLTAATSMPFEVVLEDRFVAVVWRDNPAVEDRLTLEDLHRLPYLGYQVGSSASMVDRLLRELGYRREPDTLVESFVVGAHMLRGTLQVTFLQERLATLFRESDELRLVEPPIEFPPLIETISWHPRSTGDAAHQWLRTRIGGIARGLGSPGRGAS